MFLKFWLLAFTFSRSVYEDSLSWSWHCIFSRKQSILVMWYYFDFDNVLLGNFFSFSDSFKKHIFISGLKGSFLFITAFDPIFKTQHANSNNPFLTNNLFNTLGLNLKHKIINFFFLQLNFPLILQNIIKVHEVI